MRSFLSRRVFRATWHGVLLLLASPLAAQQEVVVLTGRVTDQATGAAVVGARVQITGTTIGAVTNAQGQYSIRTTRCCQLELRVVALGYASTTRSVTVAMGQTTTADWALRSVPFALEEIVTTAVGEQLTRELGNAVARVDAPRLVETAPVTSLAEVLGGGRIAGVTVIANDGVPGAGARVRIRGLSSASLSNDPLLYVDGVRVSERGVPLTTYVGGGSPSFLNDLNPEEIENIEIVKGPSAATLYGTQAANGVIRVTTKKGRSGPPRWQVYGEAGIVKDVTDYPALYYSKAVGEGTCLPWQQAAGTCQIEQLYVRNVFEEDQFTPRRDGYRYQVGTQVSGGTDASRYFVSAEYERVMGNIKMPESEIDFLLAPAPEGQGRTGEIPDYQLNPSQLSKINLRANVGANLGSKTDISVSTGYVYTDNLIPQTGDNLEGLYATAIFGTANPEAQDNPWGFARPAYGLSHNVWRKSDHFTPSATANYRPLTWLSLRATGGLDYVGYRDDELARNGEICPFCGVPGGLRSLNRFVGTKISAEVGATATFKLTEKIGSKTSIGSQYNKDLVRITLNQGTDLPPGGETFSGAAVKSSSEQTTEFRTLGNYIEQQFSYQDRFFLTGAIRVDKNSAFGEENRSATYPKVSASWVAIENAGSSLLSQLRLRGAYGQSGQQPGALAAITYFNPVPSIFLDAPVPGVTVGGLGNTAVKPERSREWETGFDASLWSDRITAEFTYYHKKTTDALVNRELPGSLGAVASRVENVGVVTNKGVEVSILGRVLDNNSLTWDIGVEYATNKNRLEELAEGVPPLTGFGYRNAPGYPLFGVWWPRLLSFDDANDNGFIEPGEFVVSDTAEFNGNSLPTKTLGFSSSFGFFRNRLRLLTLFDYKGGFVSLNVNGLFQCAFIQNCRELNDPSATLEEQAKAVSGPQAFGGWAEDGTFVRLRELALTYDLPARWVQWLRGRTASVTLTGRNLALWTDFTSWDPENLTQAGVAQDATPYNFVQEGQPRTFIFRINLGF